MLPPMRPSPTIPSCTSPSWLKAAPERGVTARSVARRAFHHADASGLTDQDLGGHAGEDAGAHDTRDGDERRVQGARVRDRPGAAVEHLVAVVGDEGAAFDQ